LFLFGTPGKFVQPVKESIMIVESFDRRTLSNMEVALERVCEGRPGCADHGLRAYIAG
jgi:hypothetical protein